MNKKIFNKITFFDFNFKFEVLHYFDNFNTCFIYENDKK
jgi:hypothetical protein